jgi:hypothetical protein
MIWYYNLLVEKIKEKIITILDIDGRINEIMLKSFNRR